MNPHVDAGGKANQLLEGILIMTLTVKEKEHWKERISCRINHAIETLCAKEAPLFRERLRGIAHQRAVASLGIAEQHARLAEIKLAGEALDQEHDTLVHTIGVRVLGDAHSSYASYGLKSAVENAICERAKVHERELLAEEPLGRRILQLELEQDDLLDTVWLATSPVQIKQLWTRVSEILDQQPTTLQQHALALQPLSDHDT